MPLYEHVFLARQDLAQAQVDALAETATKIVEDNNGKVVKTETWGLRSLAYKIAKNRKAHYVMLEIDAPAGVVAELERQHAERQKRVGVLQTASMNASVENERLLQRLRAAEKPSLASAADSEKLGKRIAQLECDAREAAAKHHRENDELRLHCAQLAQQAQA